MKCRFLKGRYVLHCNAEGKMYIPGSFEIQEYCNGNGHKICPLYFKVDAQEKMGAQAWDYPFWKEVRR